MSIQPSERIDLVNILLIILSAILAIIIPFELFLFSYAILGPLHYLTEISWLHDRKYFTKSRYDAVYFIIIGLCLSVLFFNPYYKLELDLSPTLGANLSWIALLLAILFVSIKDPIYRILGMIVIVASIKVSNMDTMVVYLMVFLPTLIHVYLFTGLFMLYGALKSKSRMGLLSVFVFVLCPFILVNIFPDRTFFEVTEYGQKAYTGGEANVGFHSLHMEMMKTFFSFDVQAHNAEEARSLWLNAIFHSSKGILIARIIGFAYTYHYLNWFSKTKVIQWHKVPRSRFMAVIAIWLVSISLYLWDYTLAMVWLFFLSMMHVLLELPLNVTSITGIIRSLRQRMSKNEATVTVKN